MIVDKFKCVFQNQTYVLQEVIDYSLGRFLRDPSVCAQPIEKVDICRQLVTGVKYLHSRVSYLVSRFLLDSRVK